MPKKAKFVVLCIVDNMGNILCLLLSTFNWCGVWLAYVVCENAKHGQIWLFVHNILYEYRFVPFLCTFHWCVYMWNPNKTKFVMLCIIFEWCCRDTTPKRNLALDLPLGGPYLQVHMYACTMAYSNPQVVWHCYSQVKVLKNDFQWSPYQIMTQKGNGTWCHHSQVKVLTKCFPMTSLSYNYQKRQWHMMQSLPCESTQKTLSDDPHIVLWPKKAISLDAITPKWKYSKNAFWWSLYHTLPQKGKCPNLYITKSTCTNIFPPSKNSNRSVCGKKCNHLIHLGQIQWLHNNFQWIPLVILLIPAWKNSDGNQNLAGTPAKKSPLDSSRFQKFLWDEPLAPKILPWTSSNILSAWSMYVPNVHPSHNTLLIFPLRQFLSMPLIFTKCPMLILVRMK